MAVLPEEWRVASADIERTLRNVRQQSYPSRELWLPGTLVGAEADERLRPEPDATTDSERLERVIAGATGECLVPIPLGVQPDPDAFRQLATAIASANSVVLVYADEDYLDAAGARMAPAFKTNWDPELMLGRDAVGPLAALDRGTALRPHAARGGDAGVERRTPRRERPVFDAGEPACGARP